MQFKLRLKEEKASATWKTGESVGRRGQARAGRGGRWWASTEGRAGWRLARGECVEERAIWNQEGVEQETPPRSLCGSELHKRLLL